MKKVIVGVFIFFALGMQAQKGAGTNKSYKTAVLVDGVCNMCKERIEKAVLKTKGVKYATWDVHSKELTLIYNQKKTSMELIQKSVLAAGHDMEKLKATNEAYQNLHNCCKYREDESH